LSEIWRTYNGGLNVKNVQHLEKENWEISTKHLGESLC
jgi:hypothetical protein